MRLSVLVSTAALAMTSLPASAALVVSADATANVTCMDGICSADSRDAVLNRDDLARMLAGGDVTVASGAAADIEIAAPLSWSSARRLTLKPRLSLHVSKPVRVLGTGAVTIDKDAGADFFFDGTGRIEFSDLGSSLIVAGHSYTLFADLASLAGAITAHWHGFYALGRSYDASADGPYGAAPIAADFTGTFEGLGNRISNFTMGLQAAGTAIDAGLFRSIAAQGTVRDLRLSQAAIALGPGGTSGNRTMGLLAARSSGTIQGVVADGSLRLDIPGDGNTGETFIGGIVGRMQGGLIAYTRAAASIEAVSMRNMSAGGVVGSMQGGSVWRSAATGNVSADGWTGTPAETDTGGLIGYMVGDSAVEECWASGDIYNRSNVRGSFVGGLIGRIGTYIVGTLRNNYATGNLDGQASLGTTYSGGLIGYNSDYVSSAQSYATGVPDGWGAAAAHRGGLFGVNFAEKGHDIYWNTDTSGIADGTGTGYERGQTGLTDAQLKAGLPAGFNAKVWARSPDVNHGWPYLINIPPR